MQIVYLNSDIDGWRFFHPKDGKFLQDLSSVLCGSECNWIVPDFVRPIHYSIFEDE